MKQTNSKGFTIIELLIVLAIIAVIAAIATTMFNKVISEERATKLTTKTENCELKWFTVDDGPRFSKGFVVESVQHFATGHTVAEVKRVTDGMIYVGHAYGGYGVTGHGLHVGKPAKVAPLNCASKNRNITGHTGSFVVAPMGDKTLLQNDGATEQETYNLW